MRQNSYAGPCRDCGVTVAVGEGHIKYDNSAGKWKTYHKDGECPTASSPERSATVSPTDNAVDRVIELMTLKFTDLIPELVALNLAKLSRVAEIKINKAPAIKLDGAAHAMLPTLITAVVAGTAPYVVGPAGSGKTTLAMQIAKVLKRKFYMEARVTSEFKLIGFIDATGNCARTQFREAYEHGGVFLFDEVDASDPDAMTAFNAALANGVCAFPDALVERHADFVAIAAGNTFGRGADRQHVGRNQLDAATLDRFCIFEVDYDEQLELELSGDLDWARHVQRVRKAVDSAKVRHIVSPRASLYGAKLLAAGMERQAVEEATIWKGLEAAQRARVEQTMKGL